MKVISKEYSSNGNIDVLCEESRILGFRKIKIHYHATKEQPKGYWNWKSPTRDIDGLTIFKLDNYCNEEPSFKYFDDYILFQSFDCVLGNEVETCVFKKMRSIADLSERHEYVKALSLDQKIDVYNHHKNCIKERTQFKALSKKRIV